MRQKAKRKYTKRHKRFYKGKRGVATAAEIVHETNVQAEHQLEVMIGSDRIVRINVDGVCAMRVRCLADCEIRVDQNTNKLSEVLA